MPPKTLRDEMREIIEDFEDSFMSSEACRTKLTTLLTERIEEMKIGKGYELCYKDYNKALTDVITMLKGEGA